MTHIWLTTRNYGERDGVNTGKNWKIRDAETA
jgi:hypothetical protein